MTTEPTIPACILEHLRAPPLRLVQCSCCHQIPDYCQLLEDDAFSKGKCLTLECNNHDCERKGTWYVCVTCSQKFDRFGKAEQHWGKAAHKKKLAAAAAGAGEPAHVSNAPLLHEDPDRLPAAATAAAVSDHANDSSSPGPQIRMQWEMAFGHNTAHPIQDSSQDDDGMFGDPHNPNLPMDAYALDAPPICRPPPSTKDMGVQTERSCEMALFTEKPESNDYAWLEELLQNTPKASVTDVQDAFCNHPNMLYFWSGEHATPDGKVGGGLRALVGRAFECRKMLVKLPAFKEAQWHMKNFIQFVSMSDAQRDRQVQIVADLCDMMPDFFQSTWIPNAKELRKVYGDGNSHTLWNALPIPEVQQVGDIGYVSPLDVLVFAFACGFDVDNVFVKRGNSPLNSRGNSRRTFHVSDCQAVQNMKRCVAEVMQTGDCSYDVVIILPCNDWKDGHGVNHTKNNRNSVVTWSWTMSPMKDNTNTTDNTLAIAIGAKSSIYWADVEHRFTKDLEKLGDAKKPLRLYHGKIKKMCHVYVKRITSLADKVERAESTHTLGHSGLMHKRYGHLIKLETPICNVKEIKNHIQQLHSLPTNKISWGWCDKASFYETGQLKPNGSLVPACATCRALRVRKLLQGKLPGELDHHDSNGEIVPCSTCADWLIDESTANRLAFAADPDYPKNCADLTKAPAHIQIPVGREVPLPTVTIRVKSPGKPDEEKEVPRMQYLPLDFERMKMALRVAFFNATRPQSKERWPKTKVTAFLKSCGLNGADIDQVWAVATDAREKGEHDKQEYYTDQKGIGKFRFPASWMATDIGPSDYIELIMHILFLGVAESNFALISQYLKATKTSSDTAFKKNAQELLEYLRRFGLSWLKAYPFGKGGGTGPWVSDNWLCWTRLSKVVYYWCNRNGLESRQEGSDNVLRTVICFVAMVARVMSHSGMTKQ